MAIAKKKKKVTKKAVKPVKKKPTGKPAKKIAAPKKATSKTKKTAVKKPVSKSKKVTEKKSNAKAKLAGTVTPKLKTKKSVTVKKSITPKTKSTKEPKRRLVDVADDIVNDDLERLTPAEIEKELEAYNEPKPPSASIKPPIPESDSPGLHLAKRIAQLMFEKKAENVVVADLEGLTSVTDYFVMCTATSDMHARAISDHVQDELEKAGSRVHHKEGHSSLKWVLLDYIDVIAHVFQKETREFYDLERLWGDAQFFKMKDDASR